VKKVVVKILQGSVVAQTILGGLTTYPLVAKFPIVHVYMYHKL